jgi:hypothetical protein
VHRIVDDPDQRKDQYLQAQTGFHALPVFD